MHDIPQGLNLYKYHCVDFRTHMLCLDRVEVISHILDIVFIIPCKILCSGYCKYSTSIHADSPYVVILCLIVCLIGSAFETGDLKAVPVRCTKIMYMKWLWIIV